MSVKINYGRPARHPSPNDREKDRSKISIDWDQITERYHARIREEIERGLDPVEREQLPEFREPVREGVVPTGKSESTRKFFNGGTINTNGAERKYNHEEIIQRYLNGESGTAIAKSLGANKATVYGVLRQHRIKRREYSGGANQFTARLSESSSTLS